MVISIVVPVYNSGKRLGACVKSLVQAMEDFDEKGEILLINNNSTDDSAKIMQEWHKKYPKLIRLEGCAIPGAAAVRNRGAKLAKGQYIWFVDSDDTVRRDAIQKLMERARETEADMVMLGVKRVYQDGHTDYLSAVCPKEPNYKSRFVRYGLGPFQVLIRRKWWVEHNFEFREGIIHEDMELMSALILYTDRYACVDEPLYNYYQNPESVLHKTKWDPHYLDIFAALEGLYDKFLAAEALEQYHDELEWFFIWNLLIDSAKDFKKFKEGRMGLDESRKMLMAYFPEWRKNRFLKEKPLKLRILVRLNYRSVV